MSKASEQLQTWQGEFGADYARRNAITEERVAARLHMWRTLLPHLDPPPASILEVGANVGLNLAALAQVSDATLYALEPNRQAREVLLAQKLVPRERALDGAAEAIGLADAAVDLVFTTGVLIHIAPETLLSACREMHRVARRYVIVAEYFSTREETVLYHERDGLLFKRDFGAFWLDNFDDLALVDYGFFWKRATGLDDLTWWIFRKTAA